MSVPHDELNAILQGTADPPATKRRARTLSPGSWALIVSLAAFVGAVGLQLTRQQRIQPQPGQVAPVFRAPDLLNPEQQIDLMDYHDSIVVLNFWGSWCPPCRAEAPDLQAIYEDYAERGVIVLGMNWLDTERDASAFLTEFGITYPNAFDLQSRVGQLYAIQSVPETYVIDREGVVREAILGAADYRRLAQALDRLLAAEAEQGS
ncbi:MAG: TlpA family protein disulfide reductase [Anaerolineae bacterium]|nr:TlpA family protein disulfide reductase [Anaerolineae bacterium]MDW8172870.1 TlpA disulfide reductase family protein [Anaerolineae bacterium]